MVLLWAHTEVLMWELHIEDFLWDLVWELPMDHLWELSMNLLRELL